jgi:transcriptional regulator with XRE-family HTH domain
LEPSAAFGEVLRHLRKEKLFSQEKLALECGLERTFISFLERGMRQPSLGTLLKLSKVLGVSAAEMVARVETRLEK